MCVIAAAAIGLLLFNAGRREHNLEEQQQAAETTYEVYRSLRECARKDCVLADSAALSDYIKERSRNTRFRVEYEQSLSYARVYFYSSQKDLIDVNTVFDGLADEYWLEHRLGIVLSDTSGEAEVALVPIPPRL